MHCLYRICAIAVVIVLTSCSGGTSAVTSTPTPVAATVSSTASATPPAPEPPTVTASVTPSVVATANAGAGGTNAPQTTPSVTPNAPTATASATPTPTALPATSPTGWRYRDPNFPEQLFHFAGVRCGTPADLSGEWVMSDIQVVEGVPITASYVFTIDANQRTGSWVAEQSFETEDVRSVGGMAGSVTQIILNGDGSVTFALSVGTPIEGKLITPDGEFPFDYPFPQTTLDGMTWDPIYGACP